MLTVHGLRKLGFKVTVHHSRYIAEQFGGKSRGPKDLVNIAMPDITPRMFAPCGGETVVSIKFPKKDVYVTSVAKCQTTDNYSRKEGVRWALKHIEDVVIDELKKTELGEKYPGMQLSA